MILNGFEFCGRSSTIVHLGTNTRFCFTSLPPVPGPSALKFSQEHFFPTCAVCVPWVRLLTVNDGLASDTARDAK